MFRLRGLLRVALPLMLFASLFGACGAPAAPAAEQALPAEAAASSSDLEAAAQEAAAEEAGPGGVEAPPVNPAALAAEATALPGGEETAVTGEDGAPENGTRMFRILPEQSSAQYAVEEEFFGQAVSFITAVGKTNAIDGQVTLNFDGNAVTVADNQFTVDISTLTSDRPRRDKAIRDDWLESSKYPIATFVATTVSDLPADAALGKDVGFTVTGDLTVRDITRPQTWAMQARVDGDTLAGTATTNLLMRDFGFAPPDIGGILKVTDGVTVTVDFVAREVLP